MLSAFAQSTAFTYQGRLNDGANPANGSYDLTFALFDAGSTGAQLAGTVTNQATAVSNGLFTVTLDFGNQFPGANRWVEIAVRTNGVGTFSTLAPRQPITATPYALQAANATTAGSASSVAAANLSGTLLNSSLPASPTFSGTATASAFTGSGAAVTALNAGNIASGTLNDARLSSNVALRDATQTFTGANTMNNPANNFSGAFNGNFSGSGAALTNVNLMNALSGVAVTLTTNASSFGFSIASAPLVGDNPHSVVTADVNGDGRADLVSANFGVGFGNTLSVLTNNGSGGFAPASSPGVGNGPVSVVAVDINGDGKVDLISANQSANTLSVLTNNGSGTFGSNATLTVGNMPYSVTAADVNGDAKPDLISANFSGTLSVLTNNGSGEFVLASSPALTGNPNAVVAADVNGDSTMDLISANFNGPTLSILLGTGTGNFVLVASPVVGSGPFAVTTADVNGDGKVDLISANLGANTLSVLTNNGAGTFGSNATLTVGSGPRSVVAADVNRDGKVDLIAGGSSTALSVFTNNGSGGFALAVSPNTGAGSWSLAAADFNGDTNLDLVSATGGSTVMVLFNTLSVVTVNTSATFQGNFTGSTLSVAGNLTAGNFTGNGGSLTGLNPANLTGGTAAINISGNAATATSATSATMATSADSFTGSLAGNVTGTQGATVVATVGGQSAANVASAASAANAATSANTASTIVKRDASGNFSASIITATLSGNATTATSATSATSATTATSFSGSLAGDVTGTQGAAAVASVGGQSAVYVANGASAANAATNINTANTIVKRDATGSFSAGKITSTNFTGNAVGLTNLDATSLASGTVPDARLTANVAMKNGDETFAGNLTIGGFPVIAQYLTTPTNTQTLTPAGGYVKLFAVTTARTLNTSTAIANGPALGAILIIQGSSDVGTVTVPDGANTRLGSNLDRVLGSGDTLILIWDGIDWVELSYVNN